LGWLVGVLGEILAEPVEAALPARPPFGDPTLSGPQRRRLDVTGAHPPDLFGPDESARLQNMEMLDDPGKRHGERFGELADRGGSAAQPLHHDPAGGIRQRLEHAVERRRLVKHSLKYKLPGGDEFLPAGGSLRRETRKGAPLSLRPLPEPSAIVLVIGGSITCADVPALCERVRVFPEEGDAGQAVCDVGALVGPDVGTVDALARLQLAARRLGRPIWLRHASAELQELLALVGLGEVLPLSAGLRLGRPGGQTEEREQGLGVEERCEADDPTG
jgi:STAS domain